MNARSPWILASLILLACAEDSVPAAAGADAATPLPDTAGDPAGDVQSAPDVPLGPAPDGVRAHFDPAAPADTRAGFWDFPFPSDLRLDAGRPVVSGIGNPNDLDLFQGLLDTAADRSGFPVVPVAWFRFDAAVAAQSDQTVVPAAADSPLLLIDVDPASPERGRLLPVVARTLEEDGYLPAHVLAVAPRPGIVLAPRRTYAVVVRRSLNDAAGAPLGVPDLLWSLAHGRDGGLAPVAAAYQPLWETLETVGVPADSVAAATVFTTGDVVAELHALTEQVLAWAAPGIEGLAADPTDHPRFCELHGTIDVPEFQAGTPPFDTGGLFVFDGAGQLQVQRTTRIPVVVTVPKQPMPDGGFPLVMYFHGSGGLSTQVVDRGKTETPGGPPRAGEGPAHVLAAHGFAAASSALPVNPERVPGASGIAYLNFSNLKAFRDTFRQGVIEQRLLLSALLTLEIDAPLCPEVTLPEGAEAITFRADPVLAMGQSMGGMYTNMVGAVEPRFQALVPTGAGGFWTYFILKTSLIPGVSGLLQALLGTSQELSFLHPALHVAQIAWEPSEPMVYMPRLAIDPLPGHPVRPIYEPVGKDDEYFPTTVYDAIALAYGHQQAGASVWDSMQSALALLGLDGLMDYPVSQNRASAGGEPYTGVVVQYAGDGLADPHVIFVQLDSVKHQYGCFFETFLKTGVATVPAPAALGTPCAGPR